MEKICFECGIKGETLTGPVFLPSEKLKAFYRELDVSEPVIENMQEGDFLCPKCANKAECRHALKFYNYYQEKWSPEQYEVWAKSNSELISQAEMELQKQKNNSSSPSITNSHPLGTEAKPEKLAIIEGNPTQNGQMDSTGQAIINSELSIKFETFCKDHVGKILDWNVNQQNNSEKWFIFIRYTD